MRTLLPPDNRAPGRRERRDTRLASTHPRVRPSKPAIATPFSRSLRLKTKRQKQIFQRKKTEVAPRLGAFVGTGTRVGAVRNDAFNCPLCATSLPNPPTNRSNLSRASSPGLRCCVPTPQPCSERLLSAASGRWLKTTAVLFCTASCSFCWEFLGINFV